VKVTGEARQSNHEAGHHVGVLQVLALGRHEPLRSDDPGRDVERSQPRTATEFSCFAAMPSLARRRRFNDLLKGITKAEISTPPPVGCGTIPTGFFLIGIVVSFVSACARGPVVHQVCWATDDPGFALPAAPLRSGMSFTAAFGGCTTSTGMGIASRLEQQDCLRTTTVLSAG